MGVEASGVRGSLLGGFGGIPVLRGLEFRVWGLGFWG